jgi:hypothetical protein
MNGPDTTDVEFDTASDPIGQIALPGTEQVGARTRALAGLTSTMGALGMVVTFSSLTSSLHVNPF